MERGGEKARTEDAEDKTINLGINLANNEAGNATHMARNTNLQPLFLPPFAKFVKQSYFVIMGFQAISDGHSFGQYQKKTRL